MIARPWRPVAAGTLSALALSGCASMQQPGDAWWGPDKAKHFVVCFALAAGTSYVLADRGAADEKAVPAGIALAGAAGVGKELYDRNVKRTDFSGKDLVWDFVGGLLGGFAGAAAAGE